MANEHMGRCTRLSVDDAAQGGSILPGHSVMAPPDLHMMVIEAEVVVLQDGPEVRHSRPSADELFRSAAEFHGSRVLGVVQTGATATSSAIGSRRANGIPACPRVRAKAITPTVGGLSKRRPSC